MNEESGPPAQYVNTPPEHAGFEDPYHEGYFGLHPESPYTSGSQHDLSWRAGQRDAQQQPAGTGA